MTCVEEWLGLDYLIDLRIKHEACVSSARLRDRPPRCSRWHEEAMPGGRLDLRRSRRTATGVRKRRDASASILESTAPASTKRSLKPQRELPESAIIRDVVRQVSLCRIPDTRKSLLNPRAQDPFSKSNKDDGTN
jgi:hypothetical protein